MKKLTKEEQREREETLDPKNWNYPQSTKLIVTASGTVIMAPKTAEEWQSFSENDLYVEGYNYDD